MFQVTLLFSCHRTMKSQHCPAWQLSQGRPLQFPQGMQSQYCQTRWRGTFTGGVEAASTESGEASSIGKTLRIQRLDVLSFIRIFPQVPFPTYKIPFFTKHCPYFNSRHCEIENSICILIIHGRMRFWVRFSRIQSCCYR